MPTSGDNLEQSVFMDDEAVRFHNFVFAKVLTESVHENFGRPEFGQSKPDTDE